jgi:hypothetical protein
MTEDHKKVEIHKNSSFISNNSNNLFKKPYKSYEKYGHFQKIISREILRGPKGHVYLGNTEGPY